MTCPSCAATVPDGAKFCPSCGAALTVASDERRVATVLFADVVGYTALSETRDPESVKYLLDRCFERLAADVTSHGGRVDKIVGDELMAVFGHPVAHEDDPERAVRTALQMRRTLIEHDADARLDVRIGINTGEVVVGGHRRGGDLTALGDVVNTASRLQHAAEPGQIVVGGSTYEATKDVISYEPLGRLELKGKGEPVDAWRAIAALGPPGARPGRMRTPLFGRKAELGMLWHALGTTVEHRRPHLVLLVGEAGMGKTVLVSEACEIARSQHDALVVQGRCLPYGEANPWWPVAEALREACGIDPDDPADSAAAKCREAVASVLGAADEGVEAGRVADGLLYLMGYEGALADTDPSRARDEAVRAIQLTLAANARIRPLVIVLSEIHWADQVVLDLIDTMLERLRNLPIVLLATARPEIEERWTPKPGRHNLFVLNLDALSHDDARALARSLLDDATPGDLVDDIVERSGGNPLFIYELAMLLGEAGDHHAAHRDVAELPATLRGLVAARIDSLDRTERSVLEDAAVVGRTGTVDALVEMAEARGESHADERLRVLSEKDLLVVADGDYEFRSDLVRDVAYETLTKADRARRHASVAKWLRKYAEDREREDEYLERIAHHYAVAAELVGEIGSLEEVPEETVTKLALDWLAKAVERAETRETTGASVHLLEHALQLVGDRNDRIRGEFLLSRARGLGTQREMARAYTDVSEALRIADAIDDNGLRARALTVRGECEQREGELNRAAATLEQAVGLWEEVGDRRGEAEALRLWGFTSIHRGELDAAEKAISQALDISRNLGDRKGEAWAIQNLAWAAFSRGDFDLAEERLTASARMFAEIGDLGGRSWAIGLLGYIWYFKGRLEEAGSVAESSVDFSREMGDRWGHGMMLNLLASVRLWQGRTNAALISAREAKRVFEQISDEMGLVNASMVLAYASLFAGRPSEALQTVDGILAVARELFTVRQGAAMTAAQIHALVGDGEQALRIFEAMRRPDADDAIGAPTTALALLLLGRFEDAYERSRIGFAEPDDPGPRANAACIHALCAAAAGHPEEAIEAGDEVGRIGGSYVDQVRAHLGRAFGFARLGDGERARAAVDSAGHIVSTSEDELHIALVSLAAGVIATDEASVKAARTRLGELGIAPQPWERAFIACGGG